MYCNYCGKPLNPGEVCSCQQHQPYQQYQQPAYSSEYFNGGYFNTEPATPAIAVLRKHGSSPLMLTTAILYLVSVVLSIVSSFTMFQSVLDVAASMDPSFPQELGSSFTAILAVCVVFANVINYISIGALFSIYRNCKKPIDSYIKTGGLTVFKVFSIIAIVFLSLYVLMIILFGVIMIALSGELAYEMEYLLHDYGMYGDVGTALGIGFGVLFFVLAAILVFIIIVQAALIRTINSLKNTCRTGAPALKVSGFYAVMLIISAVYYFVCIPFNFIGSAFLVGVLPLLVYSVMAAAMGVMMILSAVLLFRVRKDMRELVMSTAQPSYMPPVYTQNDGPTAYYYNPQQPEYTAPVEPAEAEVPAEPVDAEATIEIPQEPIAYEAPLLYTEEVHAEVPEIEVPAEEPTAEPVAEIAEELVEEPAVPEAPAEVTCPACGRTYAPTANFCVYCGTPNPNK